MIMIPHFFYRYLSYYHRMNMSLVLRGLVIYIDSDFWLVL
jgi:hypothetical protein